MSATRSLRTTQRSGRLASVDHAHRRTCRDIDVQSQDENGSSAANLRATFAGCGVRARLDQGTLRLATISLPRATESDDGSYLGLLELQLNAMVPITTCGAASRDNGMRRKKDSCRSGSTARA